MVIADLPFSVHSDEAMKAHRGNIVHHSSPATMTARFGALLKAQ
jgi:hypothetical protein